MVVSHFGFGDTWKTLIALVPGHCLSLTRRRYFVSLNLTLSLTVAILMILRHLMTQFNSIRVVKNNVVVCCNVVIIFKNKINYMKGHGRVTIKPKDRSTCKF